jgi:uncharacterized protein (UPF0276 family)
MDSSNDTKIGMSYGTHAVAFLDRKPDAIDYVEIPFEALRHQPGIITIQEKKPVLLHCASMSIAGFVPPDVHTLDEIEQATILTKTPWIGEHLSFIEAEALASGYSDPHDVTSLTLTVCPQLSEETLEKALDNLRTLRKRFSAPLILENPPGYFVPPGSTMSLVDFMIKFFNRCDEGMILDIAHFLITTENRGLDASKELARLPLERIVEVHMSGNTVQSGVTWDDHGSPAPESAFSLLAEVLERVQPKAVTFEYNWAPDFPDEVLTTQINRIREMTSSHKHA